jgi:hypothetical protein
MTDKLLNTEKEILAIADEMAASVTKLNPQTYDTFLSAREKLQTTVHAALNQSHSVVK